MSPKMWWSAPAIMRGLAERVERDLRLARSTIGHAPALGASTEQVWIRIFDTYLPQRYCARSATVMDSENNFSDQIDIVIFDRQYSPTMFELEGTTVIPIESVYAVFESKQTLRGEFLAYAQQKALSVRRLTRTSVVIPTINGNFRKNPQWILAGFLALEPYKENPDPDAVKARLEAEQDNGKLDFGCVATHGVFGCSGDDSTTYRADKHAGGVFLLELMARLQSCGTAPAIDYRAYGKWMNQEE